MSAVLFGLVPFPNAVRKMLKSLICQEIPVLCSPSDVVSFYIPSRDVRLAWHNRQCHPSVDHLAPEMDWARSTVIVDKQQCHRPLHSSLLEDCGLLPSILIILESDYILA